MNENHTPGPWAFDPRFNWIIAANTMQDVIAENILLQRSDGFVMVEDERRKANAHLIAAAPELLEALTYLLNETEDYIKINHLSALHNHSLEMARKAIAKAQPVNALHP